MERKGNLGGFLVGVSVQLAQDFGPDGFTAVGLVGEGHLRGGTARLRFGERELVGPSTHYAAVPAGAPVIVLNSFGLTVSPRMREPGDYLIERAFVEK